MVSASQNVHSGNSHEILLVSVSWRNVLDLDSDFLWAWRLRHGGGLGSLHDLHVRPGGQMIGEGIACGVDALRRLIDRHASNRRKPSLNGPSSRPGIANDFAWAGQFPGNPKHQRFPIFVQGRWTHGGETDVAGVNDVLAPAGDW